MAKKLKNILISQPDPGDENSPYKDLSKKHGAKFEFRLFIKIEGVTLNDFRKQNINPLEYDGVIFTSKQAIDHYFRITKEMKQEMPPDMKYLCVTEATAKYLQKYIVIRKRKLFIGERTSLDLAKYLKKFHTEKFLFPCSSVHTPELTDYMKAHNIQYARAVMYNTVAADLSDLKIGTYDIICFFSTAGVEALLKAFPDFKKSGVKVGTFGTATAKACADAGLKIDIEAPKPNLASMAAGIEDYLKNNPGD